MSFQPGDHIRVRRPRGYSHHAIMVHDGQVVEVGGPTRFVTYAPFERFKDGSRVQVVTHPNHDPELAVRRAEWLVSCPPPRRYNVIGFNCEHVARWCANGWETESLQVRHFFLARSLLIGVPVQFGLAWMVRTSRPLPRLGLAAIIGYVAFTSWTLFRYHNEIRLFNQHLRKHCPPSLLHGTD